MNIPPLSTVSWEVYNLEHSNLVNQYIKTVCNQIRFKKAHNCLSDEIKNHIEDQYDTYIQNGLEEQSATIKAIEQMGDPVQVGEQLNSLYRPKPEWTLIFLTITLLLLGGFTSFLLSKDPLASSQYLEKQILIMFIGIAVLIVTYFVDYTLIGRYSKIIYILLLLFLIYQILYGIRVNGSNPVVYYIILLMVPAYSGIIFSMRNKGYLGIIYCGFYIVIPLLICVATTFSQLALFSFCCLATLTAAILKNFYPVKKSIALALIYIPTFLSSIVFIFINLSNSNYHYDRLIAAFNPNSDISGAGFQSFIIREIIMNSQFIGTTQIPKSGYFVYDKPFAHLPQFDSDFILTYIIGKFGILFGSTILLLLFIIIARMFIVSLNQKSTLGFLISFSSSLVITTQIVNYVMANLGFMIFAPKYLPFFSKGSIGMLVNMIIVGLILSTFRNNGFIKDPPLKAQFMHSSIISIQNGKLIIDLNFFRKKLNHKL